MNVFKNFFFFVFIISFLSSCTNFFLWPDRLHYYDPKQEFGLTYEDFYFASHDSLKLHAQLIKSANNNKGLLIHFHGNGQNLSAHFVNFAWLPQYGYDYFTFDYRGYGRSWGDATVEGAIKDGEKALTVAYEIYKKGEYEKLIMYGQSIGGAIILKSLESFEHTSDISLMVLDSTFADYKAQAFDTMKSSWITFLFSPLSYLLISNKYQTKENVKQLTMPSLVIHSRKDEVIDIWHGRKIYEMIPAKQKWFWELEDIPHINAFHHGDFVQLRKNFVQLLDNLE